MSGDGRGGYRRPPKGWQDFGAHAAEGVEGVRLVFSAEVDECGLPLWEQVEGSEKEGRGMGEMVRALAWLVGVSLLAWLVIAGGVWVSVGWLVD